MPQLPDPDPITAARLLPVYLSYAGLLRVGNPVAGLGGKLLWIGELDENGCALMRAANIAGAGSLGCTADPAALRHANRDGVTDFLVNSLDEALRILKNEVRKQQAVSVGVSATPASIEAEMRERGVLPDLLAPPGHPGTGDLSWFLAAGSRWIDLGPLPDGATFRAWSNPPADFDVALATILPEEDHLNRRWLRLSPRYLGPAARRVRSLACSPDVETKLAHAFAKRS